MAATEQRTPVIMPVLLAVIGVAALATAVMLVPVIIRQSVAQISATTPQPVSAPPAPADRAATAPTAPDAGVELPLDAGPVEVAIRQGPWELALSPKSYALDARGQATLSEIVACMGSHPKAKLSLVGVNNPMRSSKRAKEAARRIKESLIEAGVERYRISVAGAQEDGAKGLVVRAAVAGDQL